MVRFKSYSYLFGVFLGIFTDGVLSKEAMR